MAVPSTAARLAPGRAADVDSFTDLLTTGAKVTAVTFEPEGWLRVTFDKPVTDSEADAVRRRIMSANAADEAVRTQAEAFLATREPNRAQIEGALKLALRVLLGLTEEPPGAPPATPPAAAPAPVVAADASVSVTPKR